MIVSVHFICKHFFSFFQPGPPYFGMSRHILHVPKFGFVQPAHLHVASLLPTNGYDGFV